ncbi:pyruvate, phosphate dikinase [Rickettsiales endosymbiont of Peranema trichophorum]|uniref:pyruvate, phosphate dikinase n=1 Tax=Rickettsiales endosymbiont of Peranema trichophorum TaxID=2486577 RepID=UPI0010233CB2|nr:pyruvate, phosphate dikinase [Rickettsiales endosymbiont of Peranema trichophorum]RZI47452.1 pyruvate, phosphate dikinase [Rickettsiales endosymbiont of Peranema trichophorum]
MTLGARGFVEVVKSDKSSSSESLALRTSSAVDQPSIVKGVYSFSEPLQHHAPASLLGNKGAALAEMIGMGIPVPPGFTITTDVCTSYFLHNGVILPDYKRQIESALYILEDKVNLSLGDRFKPLLLSVRSGAAVSMPGMMDTILNLGLNDQTVLGLGNKTNDMKFAYDCYRRFIQMYGNVVLKIEAHHFESVLLNYQQESEVVQGNMTSTGTLEIIVDEYKKIVKKLTGIEFPQDPKQQLWTAISAVFDSSTNHRAVTYRKLNGILPDIGTAVNVQAMVFGNMGGASGTGVVFTRNPSDGKKELYGEYLIDAQGEDIVSGSRTPHQIHSSTSDTSLQSIMPKVYEELHKIVYMLESHYKDMQDVEFTIEQSKLWILQTRHGKRTAKAGIKIVVDLVKEGLISKEEAVKSIAPSSLQNLLHSTVHPGVAVQPVCKGLPASPGAVSGTIVMSREKALQLSQERDVILVRDETNPDDIDAMYASVGVVTARGGMTSHAAVVARGIGKPCITGVSSISLDGQTMTVSTQDGSIVLNEGDTITMSGTTGEIFIDKVPVVSSELTEEFTEFMSWVNRYKRMMVFANADTPGDAITAMRFGGEGIGLCRTEHMFFKPQRLSAIRRMILSCTPDDRRRALEALLPYQREDFKELFRIMGGKPMTIRLLDPPLHEFLPSSDKEIVEFAHAMSLEVDVVKARTKELQEHNPMLGHRGCRIGVTFPEIYEMQMRAIFEAALSTYTEHLSVVNIDIMIPFAISAREIEIIKNNIDAMYTKFFSSNKGAVCYRVGTMIELPRAALLSDELAGVAEFFSFGTNDLTQAVLGISRDDSGTFLKNYVQCGVLPYDPFVTIDKNGVGQLMRDAIQNARRKNSDLTIGVCGEHGGDPASISFFETLGLDYISCSPFRIPIAALAAAQSALQELKV